MKPPVTFRFGIPGLAILASLLPARSEEVPASRKLLFFDLWKLDDWHQVELCQGEPEWIPEGTWIDPAGPDRGVHFPTVWRDEETGEWRLVHSLKWSPFTLMAARSEDGIAWEPLPVPDAEPVGGKLAPHHLFTLPDGAGGTAYLDPQETDGFRFRIFGRQDGEPVLERARTDPNHRWHAIARDPQADATSKRYLSEAVTLVSRDGLHWELKTGGHWEWGQDDWFPEPPVFAFHRPANDSHVMTVRPGWGDRRQCLRFSPDLRTWSDPQLQFQPDALDTDGPIGMYGLPVHPVGNGAGFVGLLWIFHNASSRPVNSFNQFFGTMDSQLVTSYDGVRFFRGPRRPFIPLNPIPRHGCTQIRPCSIVETDDEVRIYSEGHRGEHGRERSEQQRAGDEPLGSLLLHRLRKDGWMYLKSRGDWARFQTKPLVLRAPGIRLNAAANYGEVRFQVTDEKSRPLAGFTFDDCLPMRAEDDLDFPLRWRENDLDQVVGRAIRLEVEFRNARIYAFDMAHHFLDAQDLWRIEDGQPVEAELFDF